MAFDTPTMIALALFVAGVAWYFLATPKAAGSPTLVRARPGRVLIDAAEEAGKDYASQHVEEQLGRQKASEITRSLAAAFAPQQPAQPGANAPNP